MHYSLTLKAILKLFCSAMQHVADLGTVNLRFTCLCQSVTFFCMLTELFLHQGDTKRHGKKKFSSPFIYANISGVRRLGNKYQNLTEFNPLACW